VRLEIGPRDLADGVATLVRRIVVDDAERKSALPLGGIAAAVAEELERQQRGLLDDATAQREARTADVETLGDARDAVADGWARVPWDAVGVEGEAELAQSGITVRCLVRDDGSLPDTVDEPQLVALVARAY